MVKSFTNTIALMSVPYKNNYNQVVSQSKTAPIIMSNLLLEASDINTTPERLKRLAYKNIELACVVALNPSALSDLLEALVYQVVLLLLLKILEVLP